MLALLALLAPKAGTDGLDVPKFELVVGVAPNRDLLSPNVVLPLEAPNGRLGGLCVPKVLVAAGMPKASVAGVAFTPPNMGTDGALLSVEPNIPPVVPPKAGDACTLVVVPTSGVPNAGAGVVLLAVSKPEVIAVVETLPLVIPNAGTVVPVCVVEPNIGTVVPPNMLLVVPKDVGDFVWPKIEVPLLNTEGVVVIGVELALVLENKLGALGVLLDDDATIVVGTKSGGAVVVLNILAVSDVAPDPDAVPKSG